MSRKHDGRHGHALVDDVEFLALRIELFTGGPPQYDVTPPAADIGTVVACVRPVVGGFRTMRITGDRGTQDVVVSEQVVGTGWAIPMARFAATEPFSVAPLGLERRDQDQLRPTELVVGQLVGA